VSAYAIERAIDIDAPVDVVWRTITEPDKIRTWFADAVELDARPNGEGTLRFRVDEPDPLVVPITVVTVDRPRTFAYRWIPQPDRHPGPGNAVLVTFTLEPDGDTRTRLRVVETGVDELDWPEAEKREYVKDHLEGWAEHGGRLQTLFEDTAAS